MLQEIEVVLDDIKIKGFQKQDCLKSLQKIKYIDRKGVEKDVWKEEKVG